MRHNATPYQYRPYGDKNRHKRFLREKYPATGSKDKRQARDYEEAVNILIEENRNHEYEQEVCSHFGCGRHLTLRERLFGTTCISHSGEINKTVAMIAKKVDTNQKEIVKQLREMGVSVAITSMVGNGFPDIVCGFRNTNYMFELKDGKKSESRKQLTEDEKKFFATWNGEVSKVESLDEILTIIKI